MVSIDLKSILMWIQKYIQKELNCIHKQQMTSSSSFGGTLGRNRLAFARLLAVVGLTSITIRFAYIWLSKPFIQFCFRTRFPGFVGHWFSGGGVGVELGSNLAAAQLFGDSHSAKHLTAFDGIGVRFVRNDIRELSILVDTLDRSHHRFLQVVGHQSIDRSITLTSKGKSIHLITFSFHWTLNWSLNVIFSLRRYPCETRSK